MGMAEMVGPYHREGFFFSGPRERFWQKPDVLESFGPRYFSSREYTLTEETMTYGYCERFFLHGEEG